MQSSLIHGRRWVLWGLVGLFGGLIALAPLPGGSSQAGEKSIQVKASNFAFNPGVIRVNRGDLVTLELVATDVMHGLYIDGYDLETTAEPGRTSRLEFVADRTGSFRLRCSVTCGGLHPFMIGKLEVGRNDLLWRAAGFSLLIVLAGAMLYRQSIRL